MVDSCWLFREWSEVYFPQPKWYQSFGKSFLILETTSRYATFVS